MRIYPNTRPLLHFWRLLTIPHLGWSSAGRFVIAGNFLMTCHSDQSRHGAELRVFGLFIPSLRARMRAAYSPLPNSRHNLLKYRPIQQVRIARKHADDPGHIYQILPLSLIIQAATGQTFLSQQPQPSQVWDTTTWGAEAACDADFCFLKCTPTLVLLIS